jgi:hypothetical protein
LHARFEAMQVELAECVRQRKRDRFRCVPAPAVPLGEHVPDASLLVAATDEPNKARKPISSSCPGKKMPSRTPVRSAPIF